MNPWPVKCLRIKQIKGISMSGTKVRNTAKEITLIMKVPKHCTAQAKYLKISGLVLRYLFTRFFAKEHILNAQAKTNKQKKKPKRLFSKLTSAHLHP